MENDDRLIDILSQSKDYVSGQELANRFNVSRTAIWKQIKGLRSRGFDINAIPHQGYRLVSYPNKLLPSAVKNGLTTTFIGQEMHHYQVLDSTNIQAKRLAEEGAPEGTVVASELQMMGKGRSGRHWMSPESESILTSIILRPQFLPHQVSQLAILATLSCAEAINKCTGIKAVPLWPNTILANNRKVGGVLVEFGGDLDQVAYVILGIGINVNFNASKFDEIAGQATSLSEVVGRKVSRIHLFQLLLQQIESDYCFLLDNGFSMICDRWIAACGIKGELVSVDCRTGTTMGIVDGIDEYGSLILATENGMNLVPIGSLASIKIGIG